MIFQNIRRRIRAAAILIELALRPGLSNVEKSTYYRSASLLLCTAVEALVHELVKKHTTPPNHVFFNYFEFEQIHKIKSGALSTPTDIYCCKRVSKNLGVSDKGADFGKYLVFLKNKGVVSPQKYKALDWVRKERNKIHIQGLENHDTGYTKAKIDKVGSEIVYLINRIQQP